MSDLSFLRVRIGITTLNDEDGWRVVVQQGDAPAKVMPKSFATKAEARDIAQSVASLYEYELDKAKIPWSKG